MVQGLRQGSQLSVSLLFLGGKWEAAIGGGEQRYHSHGLLAPVTRISVRTVAEREGL